MTRDEALKEIYEISKKISIIPPRGFDTFKKSMQSTSDEKLFKVLKVLKDNIK